MSRLDFFDRTLFPIDVPRIRLYGRVAQDSLGPLRFQYEAVWASIQRNTGVRPSLSTPRPSMPDTAGPTTESSRTNREGTAIGRTAGSNTRRNSVTTNTTPSGSRPSLDQYRTRGTSYGVDNTAPTTGSMAGPSNSSTAQALRQAARKADDSSSTRTVASWADSNSVRESERYRESNVASLGQQTRQRTNDQLTAPPASLRQQQPSDPDVRRLPTRGRDVIGSTAAVTAPERRVRIMSPTNQRDSDMERTRGVPSNSQAVRQAPTSTSNRLTHNEMVAVLQDVASEARRRRILVPSELNQLSDGQISTLAHDGSARRRWLMQIAAWYDQEGER